MIHSQFTHNVIVALLFFTHLLGRHSRKCKSKNIPVTILRWRRMPSNSSWTTRLFVCKCINISQQTIGAYLLSDSFFVRRVFFRKSPLFCLGFSHLIGRIKWAGEMCQSQVFWWEYSGCRSNVVRRIRNIWPSITGSNCIRDIWFVDGKSNWSTC